MVHTKVSAKKSQRTIPIGRDAKDGQFTTVEHAREHPRDHVVERISKSSRAIFQSTSETYEPALKRLAKK